MPMVRNTKPSDAESTNSSVNRRTVLQVLCTGAVAGVGLVGTASGHEVNGKPVFCDCSQLCVSVEGNADVLIARENDNGGYDIGFIVDGGELDPYPKGEPRYSGNFCVSTDDADVPDGKIIGLQVAGTRWVNPNQCAQDALAAEQEQLDSTHPRPEGDSGSQCKEPPEDPEDPEDPEEPDCVPCESGEELLVKYEWDDGEFITEGSDENVELTGETLDEDGEPVEACFSTEYCEVDAVVKAGTNYETYEDESGTFCVTGITTENPQGNSITQAISNVQFFCEAPEDPSVGESG